MRWDGVEAQGGRNGIFSFQGATVCPQPYRRARGNEPNSETSTANVAPLRPIHERALMPNPNAVPRPPENQILAILPAPEQERLRPVLHPIVLEQAHVLVGACEALRR